VTSDRARKQAIRARMAATGEPYSVAARKLAEPGQLAEPDQLPAPDQVRAPDQLPAPEPVSDAGAVQAVIACANRTLAEPSARIEFRIDWNFAAGPAARTQQRSSGFAGRLVSRAAKAAWERIAPDVDPAAMRETFAHQRSTGYLEPASNRYMIDSGVYAEIQKDGLHFGGLPGALVQRRHQSPAANFELGDPVAMLRLLQRATEARYTGEETLRGTACRSAAVRAGSAELTVLVDAEHVRRIRREDRTSNQQVTTSKAWTVELWDFGVPVGQLDWSHLPSFVMPS
jgi:hypothetical protein